MSRLILLWSRPFHLATADAERWATDQAGALSRMDGVRAAVLTRLGDASASQRRDWDWLLELDVELPVRDWLEEWLGDLRLLGSRRAVVVAGERIPLEET